MIVQHKAIHPAPLGRPTLWGMDPIALHDRYWAARGVCVVRAGRMSELPHGAELFLLTDRSTLVLFRLRPLIEQLCWAKPVVVFVRIRARRGDEYRETVLTDDEGRFVRFERDYGSDSPVLSRVALTRDRRVAELWQSTSGGGDTWRQLRRETRSLRRRVVSVVGTSYNADEDQDLAALTQDLVQKWPHPSATIGGIRQARSQVWVGSNSHIEPSVATMGPIWIGAGRSIPQSASVVGPAVLWDEPNFHAGFDAVRWAEIEPTTHTPNPRAAQRANQVSSWRRTSKRCFDIAFALAVLLVTLPLYPLIILAIWFEDGRPFFFAHCRETVGGREFGCIKFRSMRKDAERIKAQIVANNQSDGPQFFIENDPRVTRIGRFLRKTNLDELPQFINVLLGDMSVVGPRPSPHHENQCCPAWREARLSIRPGITGLWQVNRTRRQGLDFQEWIRFDVQYVQEAGWWLDLVIITKTVRLLLGW